MKPIEERARELMMSGRFHIFCWTGEAPQQKFSHTGKYIEYALAEKAVQQVAKEVREDLTRWIPVKQQLPKVGEWVLLRKLSNVGGVTKHEVAQLSDNSTFETSSGPMLYSVHSTLYSLAWRSIE